MGTRYRRCVVTVVSPHLVAVDAAWDDGSAAGRWIADRLAPFGPSVGHAVPLGYPAYAVVPMPADDDPEGGRGALSVIEALLDVLGPFTGDQPVHSGMWEGWGWWYDTGADPGTAPGMGVFIAWPESDARPAQDELDRTLADAREQLFGGARRAPRRRAARPSRSSLLPRDRPAALGDGVSPPAAGPAVAHLARGSLVVRRVPIYANEIAVAGMRVVVNAVIDDQRLNARAATPNDVLDIDD